LHLKQTPHGTVVVDADGRAQGTLVQSPADLLDAHPPRAADGVANDGSVQDAPPLLTADEGD